MDNRHPLYVAALKADKRYTDAIYFVTGGQRTRWTLTDEDNRTQALQKALIDKIAADKAWSAVLRGHQ